MLTHTPARLATFKSGGAFSEPPGITHKLRIGPDRSKETPIPTTQETTLNKNVCYQYYCPSQMHFMQLSESRSSLTNKLSNKLIKNTPIIFQIYSQ